MYGIYLRRLSGLGFLWLLSHEKEKIIEHLHRSNCTTHAEPKRLAKEKRNVIGV